MADNGGVVVVGGTSGLGLEIARHYAGQGRRVVVTGRDPDHAAKVAAELDRSELGEPTSGVGFDLTRPELIAGAVEGIGPVDHLVLAAILRDENTATGYDHAASLSL